jgi:hypothetical protein
MIAVPAGNVPWHSIPHLAPVSPKHLTSIWRAVSLNACVGLGIGATELCVGPNAEANKPEHLQHTRSTWVVANMSNTPYQSELGLLTISSRVPFAARNTA